VTGEYSEKSRSNGLSNEAHRFDIHEYSGAFAVSNAFSKEEKVAFDQVLEGFNDEVVATKMAKVYKTDQTTMERTGDIIWRPQPYIMTSYDGNDMSANFKDVTQLSVPASIDSQKTVPFSLTARQLRDQLQEGRLGEGARQKLASDINVSLTAVAATYGSLFIKRTVAATGFDDIALADAAFTEQGIPLDGRVMGLSPRDYNNMASNLGKPQTSGLQKTATAYEKAYLGPVSGFDTYKLNYANRLAAAVPGAGVTIENTQPLNYVPVAATQTAGRGWLNVDNRFQTIGITVGAAGALKVGDSFTLAGVNAVHHITKQDTGQLKTFRIVEIVTGGGTAGAGTVKITPPIIINDGSNPSTAQYQNVTAAPADGATMTFLNTAAAYVNVFWQGDAMEILPGRLAPAPESGLAVMRGTTDDGIELVMTRQGEINDLGTKYRFDALFGCNCLNPEMAGVILFSQ
jgi:hypothetical protein